MNAEPTKVAYDILKGFEKSFRGYSLITRQGKNIFELAQWQSAQKAIKDRIDAYDHNLTEVVAEIYQRVFPHQQSQEFWQALKQQYQKLLGDHPQYELAETFFNSVIGRIFRHQCIDDKMMFVLPSRCYLVGQARHRVINIFDAERSAEATMESIFSHYRFNLTMEDYQRDIKRIAEYLRNQFSREDLATVHQIEMLQPVFYRNKAAYLVGRMLLPSGQTPFVIALLLNENRELYVDNLLTSRRDLSTLFGFARAYFLADTQYPAETVAFLQELMPNKKNFELYISLGFYKHGKTVFYRNFLQHLDESDDQFEIAPGIKGLVMSVFHLPSYGVVFKIIKDEFGESKKITRDHVKACYRLVKRHDRVGRMADTHEYVNFRLPRHRVSEELLQELQKVAASSIELSDDEVIIKHLYIERKMTPLNMYLDAATEPSDIEHALDDLGVCIKQIAAANIFPGDMLLKNFGITRHGRVIFYDYDEICYMQERNFRDLPKSDDPYAMDTLSVAPNDVFPEQFEHFIAGKKAFKDILKQKHPEIMTSEYWRNTQQEVARGKIKDIRPYPESQRFKNVFSETNS